MKIIDVLKAHPEFGRNFLARELRATNNKTELLKLIEARLQKIVEAVEAVDSPEIKEEIRYFHLVIREEMEYFEDFGSYDHIMGWITLKNCIRDRYNRLKEMFK